MRLAKCEDRCDFTFGTFNIPSNATIHTVTVSFNGYNETALQRAALSYRDVTVSIAPDGTTFGNPIQADLTNAGTGQPIIPLSGDSIYWGVSGLTANNLNSNLQVGSQEYPRHYDGVYH
jgi:hypothetical protein